MKRNQSGFSVVEVVMAIVIVGLLAAVGWLYWDKVANKPSDSSANVSKTETADKTQTSSALKTYKLQTQPLAFDYPSSWNVKSTTGIGKGTEESERLTVSSPDGFTLNLGTFGDGLGGTGPCNRSITEFKFEGDIDKSLNNDLGVVSYTVDGNLFVLNIAGKTIDDARQDCLGYWELISLRKVLTGSENGDIPDGKATRFVFGTNVLFQDTVSKTKPSDKVYKEAVEILKSVRKV